MSGTTSAVTVAVDGFRPPFTAVQWQELEQQALIYKYMMAGLPVPPDLLAHIRRSLAALPARFFHHSALGYFSSYYGKKFDPEPGRCRRTDGKKWRCSKDAYPDSKYCERHMHRGRNRSRKPVESQSTTQSVSTATSQIITGSSTSGGSSRTRGNESFQNLPLHPLVNAETLSYGTSKFQMEHSPYGLNNKECRYLQGMTPDADEYNILSEASNSAGGLGMDNNFDNIWRLMPSQVHSSPLLKPISDSHLQDNSTSSHLPQAYELDSAMSKQRQQYCFFGNNIGSLGPVKQEQNSRRPFFEELPKTRESWSHLDDDDGCKKNTLSTTQLSISMAPSDYLSRSVCSPDEAS